MCIACGSKWTYLMERWNMARGGCTVCGEFCYGPMLHDSVWDQIPLPPRVRPHEFKLCLPCMEKALGRTIVADDMRSCEWNRWRAVHFEYHTR